MVVKTLKDVYAVIPIDVTPDFKYGESLKPSEAERDGWINSVHPFFFANDKHQINSIKNAKWSELYYFSNYSDKICQKYFFMSNIIRIFAS